VHAKYVLENVLVHVARTADGGAPHVDHRTRLEFGERLRTEGMPDIADREILADAADPIELAEIDPDPGGIEPGISDAAEIESIDDGPVLGRGRVEILHRFDAGSAGHVLHDDGRIARNVTADMAGEHPRIDVEPAARCKADHDRERLALVEILRSRGSNACQSAEHEADRVNNAAINHRDIASCERKALLQS
jgi:hypothetical protein